MNLDNLRVYLYDSGRIIIAKPAYINVESGDRVPGYYYRVRVETEMQDAGGIYHNITFNGRCDSSFKFDNVGVLDKEYSKFYWVGKDDKQSKEFLKLLKVKLVSIRDTIADTLNSLNSLEENN